jgi:hypothetical protein
MIVLMLMVVASFGLLKALLEVTSSAVAWKCPKKAELNAAPAPSVACETLRESDSLPLGKLVPSGAN